MSITSRRKEKGFTLVEIMIAMLITVIAVIGAMTIVVATGRKSAAFIETASLDDIRASTEDILKSDFDAAGHNLTRPPRVGAGTEQAVFIDAAGYTSSAGTLTKTGPVGWTQGASTARGLGSGRGSFIFTPPAFNSTYYVAGPSGSGLGIQIGAGGWAGVVENGVLVAATCCMTPLIAPHMANDSYKLSIENASSTSQATALKLFRIRNGVQTVLWTSQSPVITYPVVLSVALYQTGHSLTNVSITGAPIVQVSGGDMEVALMPLDNGVRLSGPITVGATTTILGGDTSTDTGYLAAPFDGSTGTQLIYRAPRRGSFARNDYLLLIDYAAGRSALYQAAADPVLSNPSGSDGLLLSAVAYCDTGNRAWGRLYSVDADRQYVFPVGSVIVKLAPPVRYAVTTNNRLVRYEGDHVSTVAFGVRSGLTTETVTTVGRTYNLSYELAAEGFETSGGGAATETRSRLEYSFAPRNLNLTANRLGN